MSFKVLDPSTFLAYFKMWITCMPHSYSSLVSFHYLELRNRISYINLSKFLSSPMLRAQLHHSHISPSLLLSFESKPNILSFFLFFLFVLIFFSLGFESSYKSLILPSHPYLGLSIGCS